MTQHSDQRCPNCSKPMIAIDKNNPVCPNDISMLKEIMNELDPDGTVHYQTTAMAAAEAADNLNRTQRLIDQMDNDTKPRSKRNRRRGLQLLPKSLEAIISEYNRN